MPVTKCQSQVVEVRNHFWNFSKPPSRVEVRRRVSQILSLRARAIFAAAAKSHQRKRLARSLK